MIRFAGLALIVLCGAGAGALASRRLGQMYTAAERICQMLREWAVQMAFRSSSVRELLEQLQSEPAYEMFAFPDIMLKALADGQPVRDAWAYGIQQERLLTEPLKKLLLPLGDELGVSDLEGQLCTLEQYRCSAASYAEDMRRQALPRQRLYLSIGILGGLMGAILLC